MQEVFAGERGILTATAVIDKIYARYPDRPWKENTIRAHLVALSVNHPSSRHHPRARKHAFLFSLGDGRYRRWNPEQDGMWELTEAGVQLVDADGEGEEDELQLEATTVGTSISLERDLERSLLSNLEQLEPGLRLYQEDGLVGQQLDTRVVGRLDILAVDARGDCVVIELKAGEADDRVCGQILRYMGWVKRELSEGRPVRGIIVASSFHERVKYAVEAMPNVSLKSYEVRFQFLDV